MVDMESSGDKLIIFDGECGLCHAWVRFVIRHDARAIFTFTSVYSDKGQSVLRALGLPLDRVETLIYVEDTAAYFKSQAFVKIVGLLPLPVSLLLIFRIIPVAVRDFVYDRIARHRYRLFGRRDECRLTGGEFSDRFV